MSVRFGQSFKKVTGLDKNKQDTTLRSSPTSATTKVVYRFSEKLYSSEVNGVTVPNARRSYVSLESLPGGSTRA